MAAIHNRHRIPFLNAAGVSIPPFAFCQIIDGANFNGKHILSVQVYDGSDPAVFLVNGPKTIAAGAYGHGYLINDVVVVKYDPDGAEPTPLVEWGPVEDEFYLSEDGSGFLVLSVDEDLGIARVYKLTGVSDTIIQQGAGTCPCGVQYPRGSQSVTLNSVAYEHATTYTIGTACFTGTWPFPEATFDSGSDWVTPEEELPGFDCYTGSVEGQLTLTPCGFETICGVDVLQATITLATTTNDCVDEESEAVTDDPEAVWVCRNWNPLGPTSTFELVGPTKRGDWTLPKFLCVTPRMAIEMCGAIEVPASVFVSYSGGPTQTWDCIGNQIDIVQNVPVPFNGINTCVPAGPNCYVASYDCSPPAPDDLVGGEIETHRTSASPRARLEYGMTAAEAAICLAGGAVVRQGGLWYHAAEPCTTPSIPGDLVMVTLTITAAP